jgi:hypothetical protein
MPNLKALLSSLRRSEGTPWLLSDRPEAPADKVPMLFQLLPTVSEKGSLLAAVELTGYTGALPTEALCFFDDDSARLLTTTEPYFSWHDEFWYYVILTSDELGSYHEQGAIVLRSVVNRSRINPTGRLAAS